MLEFNIPARSIIGLRNTILTGTEGEAIIAHRYKGYEPWKGDLSVKRNGALISMETGLAIAYAIDKLQDRGIFFVDSNDPVYAGQVIGEHIRPDDLVINVCKTKKLTNMRASGSMLCTRLSMLSLRNAAQKSASCSSANAASTNSGSNQLSLRARISSNAAAGPPT